VKAWLWLAAGRVIETLQFGGKSGSPMSQRIATLPPTAVEESAGPRVSANY